MIPVYDVIGGLLQKLHLCAFPARESKGVVTTKPFPTKLNTSLVKMNFNIHELNLVNLAYEVGTKLITITTTNHPLPHLSTYHITCEGLSSQ